MRWIHQNRLSFIILKMTKMSFIIDFLSRSFTFVISGNSIYARRPFLMHHFLFCIFQSSLNISPSDEEVIYSPKRSIKHSMMQFSFPSPQGSIKGKHIDCLISNLWFLGNEISLNQFCSIKIYYCCCCCWVKLKKARNFFRGHDEKNKIYSIVWLNTDLYHPHIEDHVEEITKEKWLRNS